MRNPQPFARRSGRSIATLTALGAVGEAQAVRADVARRYLVDDLAAAILPGSRLQGVLECLREGRRVTPLALGFLQKQKLLALHDLATGQLTHDAFTEKARAEQRMRIGAAEAASQAAQAVELARKTDEEARSARLLARVEAARIARESDPRYIALQRQRELRCRYGIDFFVDPEHIARLMRILKTLDDGSRLPETEFAWLSSEARELLTPLLRAAYYRAEARHHVDEFSRTQDPWAAINASANLRKCDSAVEADALLRSIDGDKLETAKVRSAVATTHGGVMRDLGRLEEARDLGEQGHALRPRDYRPCTLLGAVHMELRRFEEGQSWYDKAVELGAPLETVDQELRTIFFRADSASREAMSALLLRQDPLRFAWARPKPQSRSGRSKGA